MIGKTLVIGVMPGVGQLHFDKIGMRRKKGLHFARVVVAPIALDTLRAERARRPVSGAGL